MKLPLLYNPLAGTSRKDPDSLLAGLPPGHRARIEPIAFGPPYDFTPHIEQARAAGGPLLVWGGDGTIHHAGIALSAAGCPVPLAAVPGGSGNGLVRGLRTPLEPSGAVLRLLEGRELRMDLPRIDGEAFLNLCGTGFEAAIAHDFHGGTDRGFLSYARRSIKLWRNFEPFGLRWDALQPETAPPKSRSDLLRAAWNGPEPPLPDFAWSLCIANLPQYGSGFWIAPHADPVDGILQWATLAKPRNLDLLTQLPSLFREGGRTHLRQEGRLLRATLRLDRSLPWHLDGEPAEARDRAEFTLEPQVFRMQVTDACPWKS
ncbi:MAG: hypothetical protein IPQ13_02630 [Holophagaceae bacterium]|nr:hypothetical protein [Holophagaceae bacterium]